MSVDWVFCVVYVCRRLRLIQSPETKHLSLPVFSESLLSTTDRTHLASIVSSSSRLCLPLSLTSHQSHHSALHLHVTFPWHNVLYINFYYSLRLDRFLSCRLSYCPSCGIVSASIGGSNEKKRREKKKHEQRNTSALGALLQRDLRVRSAPLNGAMTGQITSSRDYLRAIMVMYLILYMHVL